MSSFYKMSLSSLGAIKVALSRLVFYYLDPSALPFGPQVEEKIRQEGCYSRPALTLNFLLFAYHIHALQWSLTGPTTLKPALNRMQLTRF